MRMPHVHAQVHAPCAVHAAPVCCARTGRCHGLEASPARRVPLHASPVCCARAGRYSAQRGPHRAAAGLWGAGQWRHMGGAHHLLVPGFLGRHLHHVCHGAPCGRGGACACPACLPCRTLWARRCVRVPCLLALPHLVGEEVRARALLACPAAPCAHRRGAVCHGCTTWLSSCSSCFGPGLKPLPLNHYPSLIACCMAFRPLLRCGEGQRCLVLRRHQGPRWLRQLLATCAPRPHRCLDCPPTRLPAWRRRCRASSTPRAVGRVSC